MLLGPYGSAESKAEYRRLIAENRTAAEPTRVGGAGRSDPTVAELLVGFFAHAEKHYRHKDGTPTSELHNYKVSLRPLREMYDHTPAQEFGPRALKAVRQWMIDRGWCRTQINARVGRIRRVFKWGASEELIPVAVYQSLATLAGLQAGRSAAVERDRSNRCRM